MKRNPLAMMRKVPDGTVVVFLARGSSMLPLLQTGDRVEASPVERGALRRGDVAVYTAADGRNIIHRVVKIDPLQTRGDNCGRDDPPVPEGSPVYLAHAFRRNGESRKLAAGAAGLRAFHRNQFRRKLLSALRRMATPLAQRTVLRFPAEKLTKCEFPEKTVYYAGKHPVGWLDAKGWHWMRFARYFVEPPPEASLGK